MGKKQVCIHMCCVCKRYVISHFAMCYLRIVTLSNAQGIRKTYTVDKLAIAELENNKIFSILYEK